MGKYSRIGGQAVLEGVMMRSPERMAVAVRTTAGGIALDTKELVKPGKKAWYRKTPFVRGVVNFVDMLVVGIQSLNTSAALMGVEEEPGKFEQWVSKKTGKSAMDIATSFALVLGLGLAILLFFIFPNWLAGLVEKPLKVGPFVMNLIEGFIRMLVFVMYLWVVSLAKDIKRFFAYHGAEHKVVNCYEHDRELTPANAQAFTTRHPRCGTSFLLIVMLVSVLVFAFTGWSGPWYVRMPVRIALLPVVAAVSYEALMLLAKRDNWISRGLRAPGMWLQALTTREPDDQMVEVAIAAFAACLDEEERAKVMPKVDVVVEEPPAEAPPTFCGDDSGQDGQA